MSPKSSKGKKSSLTCLTKIVLYQIFSIDRYTTAAKVYLELEDTQNAIQCLINGKEWNKAKKLAREMEPALLRKIEEEHKKFLKDTGNANELADSDIASALEMYRDRGQWDKCLETAKKHSNQLLGKYTAIYSAELIKGGKIEQALHLFIKYGPPVKENALNIYRYVENRKVFDIFISCILDTFAINISKWILNHFQSVNTIDLHFFERSVFYNPIMIFMAVFLGYVDGRREFGECWL